MSESNLEEKREFPRANFPCKFTLWPQGEGKETIFGNAANLSAGGMSAFINKSFLSDEIGEIKIENPNLDESVYCRWKAVRCEEDFTSPEMGKKFYKIAIQFTDLEEGKKMALVALVKRLLDNQGKKK